MKYTFFDKYLLSEKVSSSYLLTLVIDCLQRDLEACLTCYEFPAEHWKFIRTNNVIERLDCGVKNRSHKMAAFQNENSCLLLFYTVIRTPKLRKITIPTTSTEPLQLLHDA